MLKRLLSAAYLAADSLNTKMICRAISSTGPHVQLLDVGCWDGNNSLVWAKAASTKKIYGIEPNRAAALQAESKQIVVARIPADQIKWPYKSNSFDCVIANQVVEHLTDLDIFFKESSRVLKNNGYLIISTNNLSSWHNIIALVFGWAPFDLTNSSEKQWSIGNPLSLHKGNNDSRGKTWKHKCVYTAAWLNDWSQLYGMECKNILGSGYYPLPAIFGNLDKTHCALMTLTFQKYGL